MLDPIGGHDRLREFFVSYLDTAFRIRDQGLTADRREMLRQLGTMTTSPFIEPVPRYESSEYSFEEFLRDFPENPLQDFSDKARVAFIDLVLAGLFKGKLSDSKPLIYASTFKPYRHQVEMLARGVKPGQPGIVTSGTGSGKTESFMLPILAAIVREAVRWPSAPAAYLQNAWWHQAESSFTPKRTGEPFERPKAVRALILYPLNALVEDQMTRLRRTLDSPEARLALDQHLGGNRIFFGRYTGDTPVTSHLKHPRKSGDKKERERVRRKTDELRARLKDIQRDQVAARQHDEQTSPDEPTRFLFPATDGAELLSRWDMQETPPDVLVTNASMLSTMLAREVEASIFEKTRRWLHDEPDSQFFLVLDELHLVRGSAGTEVAGLLRVLFKRLGLDLPEHRHKLRILASSASLPTEGERGDQSIKYLDDFFGPFGTYVSPDHHGFQGPDDWIKCIVPGSPIVEIDEAQERLDPRSFVDLVDLLSPDGRLIRTYDETNQAFVKAITRCHTAICPQSAHHNFSDVVKETVEAAAKLLTFGCSDAKQEPKIRAASVETIAHRVFGASSPATAKAVRGLTVLRGLGDDLSHRFKVQIDPATPSFRLHQFIRSIEGLFATPRKEDGRVAYDGLTIERGVTYTADERGYRRKFELVYCEACGETFVGGLRAPQDKHDGMFELLPSAPDVGQLPESGGAGHYEDLSYDQFAIFWPSRNDPAEVGKNETWTEAFLDTTAGVVRTTAAADSATVIAGRLYHCPRAERSQGRNNAAPGTAGPDCCPSCGIDYSMRKKPRFSPVRSFRTGFNKTSQLMATELFELLYASKALTKAVVFSDSRQDAANAALNIERAHYQDLRRQLIIEIVKSISSAEDNSKLVDQLRVEKQAASDRGDIDAEIRLLKEIQKLSAAAGKVRIPLDLVVEQPAAKSGSKISRMLEKLLALGIHPSDDAGVKEIKGLPWTTLFDWNEEQNQFEWKISGPDIHKISAARDEIVQKQDPHIDEVLFSKTYFALEETGLGYCSIVKDDSDPQGDKMDAYLRVFADSYRVSSSRWLVQSNSADWPDADSIPKKHRLRRFAEKSNPTNPNGELNDVWRFFESKGHKQGIVDANLLVVRIASANDPYWRCDACSRVHLHRGTGVCTRCAKKLEQQATGQVREIWDRHFLAQRIVRDTGDSVSSFRLRCEELTGQTGSPAERLRRFKDIVLDTPPGVDPDLHAAASKIDLLSVTTTMEVGIDIGALQTVYQANMPPQRFNYQQRVGRAGRRGQAFSVVLTLCRSRSHDLHYFNTPASITGDPPPPPFLAANHIDIPLRLLRKAWLAAAFERIRDRMGADYPGDTQVPPDTHGEFIPASIYYFEIDKWAPELRAELEATRATRDDFATVLGAGKTGRREQLIALTAVDALMGQLAELQPSGERFEGGFAQFIAEQGLMPMYGMPTRVRPLYLGLKKSGSNDVEWDAVDRDLDLAIYEFAPGQVLVRDKLKHQAIGFTASLPTVHIRPGAINVKVPEQWYESDYHIAKCPSCEGTTVLERKPSEPLPCADCSTQLAKDAFRRFFIPRAFRTSFRPVEDDDEVLAAPTRRSVVAEIKNIATEAVDGTNLTIHAGDGATVLRLNEGPIGADGTAAGYAVKHVHQRSVWLPRGVRASNPSLPNQFLLPDALKNPQQWADGDLGVEEEIFLMSRKPTEALYLGVNAVADGLAIDLFGRDAYRSSVRAAAVSATHLIIQRAALELDVAPDEFEALEPRRRHGLPLLQIADTLVNGAGFCRRLAEPETSGTPMVVRLIRSMLSNAGDDTLVGRFYSDEHRATCRQSCYRCLQRYGNRHYHGLLDWRLGLGFLRAMIDPAYRSGLDDRWLDYPETRDWPLIASHIRDELCHLNPENRKPVHLGIAKLPALEVSSAQETRHYVMIHPLWRTTPDDLQLEPFASILRDHDPAMLHFVDTFDAGRRPVSALEIGRHRPPNR